MKPILIERTEDRSNVRPKVSINSKGSFFFNSKSLHLMGVSETSKLQIFQDEENSKIWYIFFTDSGYGKLSIKDKNKNRKTGQLSMTDVANKIRGEFNQKPEKILRFEVQESKVYESQEYFPLIVIEESIDPVKVFGRPAVVN